MNSEHTVHLKSSSERARKMIKKVRHDGYNYNFNTENGYFVRWGKTIEEDPQFSPVGPEILDLEVSTICNGLGKPCKWCYKSNTGKGVNMNLETFKKVFNNMPENLTQIAFGIGDIDSNPDLFKMFEYCRENNIAPNVTTNGWNLTDEYADSLVKLCGAVAVSKYDPQDVCFDAVSKLTNRGMKQVNIHMLFSKETHGDCMELLNTSEGDSRLEKLNAIVFLTVKPKGKRNTLTTPKDVSLYKTIIEKALNNGIRIGFDSCGANKFLQACKGRKDYKQLEQVCEPCESGVFSSYINVEGKYFPCSFSEGEVGYEEGLDVVNCDNFLKDIWFHPSTEAWRKKLLGNCRNCPIFDI